MACEIAASVFEKVKGEKKNPNSLNAEKVRKLLQESGVEQGVVDRVFKTFSTTDDSHHAAPKYDPNRDRLKQYLGYINELLQVFKKH
ncbi:MAG: hypothetical protein KKC51_10055 [Verrucomicrobia bacterium]|nr:hypothetical protein [Verrucomicrobiota bacterium]